MWKQFAALFFLTEAVQILQTRIVCPEKYLFIYWNTGVVFV